MFVKLIKGVKHCPGLNHLVLGVVQYILVKAVLRNSNQIPCPRSNDPVFQYDHRLSELH